MMFQNVNVHNNTAHKIAFPQIYSVDKNSTADQKDETNLVALSVTS